MTLQLELMRWMLLLLYTPTNTSSAYNYYVQHRLSCDALIDPDRLKVLSALREYDQP